MPGEQETLARLTDGDLRALLRLLEGSDIEELELEVAGTRLHFKRLSGEPRPPGGAGPAPPEQASLPRPATFVVAERVGFFHFATNGEAGPRQAGEWVAAGQVLGVIDSLSVPNPIQAPCAGRLDEVLVEDGQPVEFGQPLFVIEPSGE